MCCEAVTSPTPDLPKFPCYGSESEGKRKKRDANEETNGLNEGGPLGGEPHPGGTHQVGTPGSTHTDGTHPDEGNPGETQSGGPQTGMYSAARLRLRKIGEL